MQIGRYAPSPTGRLHLGNLRTALVAWAIARQAGGRFVMRFENLDDRSRSHFLSEQLADLQDLGIDWDGEPLVQSDCLSRYEDAFEQLKAAGRVYECYCSRRELSQVASAPHHPPGAYSGRCRLLSEPEREQKRNYLWEKYRRGPAYRLKSNLDSATFPDRVYGLQNGAIDDFVLRRSDGVFSYNLVCVVDDAYQGVTQVCRGRDLIPSTARQNYLHQLLGSTIPQYYHVPLVLNREGQRLAKRDGAVTLPQLKAKGIGKADILELLASSLGFFRVRSASEFLQAFDLEKMSRADWRYLGL